MIEICVNNKRRFKCRNKPTTEGMRYLMEYAFLSTTSTVPASGGFFIGLVDNAGFVSFSNADTFDSHAGWTENTDYDEGSRPEFERIAEPTFVQGTGFTKEMTAAKVFTMNTTAVIRGMAIFSESPWTPTASVRVLWATAQFPSNISVDSGDTISLKYKVTHSLPDQGLTLS